MLGLREQNNSTHRKHPIHRESFASFTNSLLREAGHIGLNITLNESQVEFKKSASEVLILPLARYSSLGRHQYQLRGITLEGNSIDADHALIWLTRLAALALGTSSEEKIQEFHSRVMASNQALQEILTDCGEFIEGQYCERELNLIDSESILYQGHSFHPYPKNRGGLGPSDFTRFSPEYTRPFKIHWALVAPEYFHEEKATSFQDEWTLTLIKKSVTSDFFKAHLSTPLSSGMKILPVHPWQRRQLEASSKVASLIAQGHVRFIEGDENASWRATSSVRSLYSELMPYMLKFSLTMRLTNSIRHLQEVEVVRGMQVHDVFHTDKGQEFLSANPQFEILYEGAFAALKDSEGKIIIESIVVCRDNPFDSETAKRTHVLASLNQPSPSGLYYLQNAYGLEASGPAREWFALFMKVVLAPLINAQANYGIYLGAHQQNIVLTLDQNGLPQKCYFRDCQGTGYSELGHSLYSKECKSLVRENGNILSEQMGSMLFCYYLIINTTFNTIISLAHLSNTEESVFIDDLKLFLKSLAANNPKDPSTLNYLLSSEALWQKGNFGCCLRDINENTIVDPMSIYNLIPNPLKA